MEVSLWSVILETLCAPVHTFKLHSVCVHVPSLKGDRAVKMTYTMSMLVED